MEEVPYKEQEALFISILVIRPEATNAQLDAVYDALYGQSPTETNIRRAREFLKLTGSPRINQKYNYIRALVSLFPDISQRTAEGKTQLYFKELTRDDIMKEQMEHGRKHPYPLYVAEAIMEAVEKHFINPQKTLGL